MQTSDVIFIIVLIIMCSLVVAQVIAFFYEVAKKIKRIANELKKMNERKGGDE